MLAKVVQNMVVEMMEMVEIVVETVRGLYLSRKPHFQLIQFLAILIFSCPAFICMQIFG